MVREARVPGCWYRTFRKQYSARLAEQLRSNHTGCGRYSHHGRAAHTSKLTTTGRAIASTERRVAYAVAPGADASRCTTTDAVTDSTAERNFTIGSADRTNSAQVSPCPSDRNAHGRATSAMVPALALISTHSTPKKEFPLRRGQDAGARNQGQNSKSVLLNQAATNWRSTHLQPGEKRKMWAVARESQHASKGSVGKKQCSDRSKYG